ncbi:cell division suppressor protein YneA [Bacillus kexueae]|uniref:cell division suppressor protein YneA n=1 Tax=Aeribacillus kexueae TaxID=2078952 RepID=UPI001FAEA590|nr:LysM peptidoglycan-binding domain-containing protein [Bacillus kexueae]
MEKLTFSYIVSLFFVMTLGVFALIYTGEKEDLSNFEEVVINSGESIWTIAEKYEQKFGMDKIEFVQWVEEKNNLQTLVVKPGDKVVIPVEKNMRYNDHLLATE